MELISYSLPPSSRGLFLLQGTSCRTISASYGSHKLGLVSQRRSAHYHPTIWDHQLIESLHTPYTYEHYAIRLQELKKDVRRLFDESNRAPVSMRLKLIDIMQRLGVSYHFEEDIRGTINDMFCFDVTGDGDLHTTALWFRILRQHAYPVSTDVFNKFKSGDHGQFLENLSENVEGLLSLYEASHLGIHGEHVLEEANNFSSKCLKYSLTRGLMEDSYLGEPVQYSLEIPLYWRMPRAEARSFIGVYGRDDLKSSVLLELAKLDFNLVQSTHQKDLRELSRWWRDLGFGERLDFSRDRLMENFIWAMGIVFEPQFSNCRKDLTKFTCILTAIDDIYDIYGSLEELEHFTDAVDRWDIKAMDNLPDYMKICYLAMFNFANELAYDVLKDHGLYILPYIKKEWGDLCRSYLMEARWFCNGYTPTLDEYLGNAWISVGGPAAMVHACVLLGCTITNELLDCFKHGSKLFYWALVITRLTDDLGTSKNEMVRGDVAKAIQCHMKEKGVSEEQAREHITSLVKDSWKKLNEECITTALPRSSVNLAVNMARTAQFIFQHGDGIGTSDGVTKDRVVSLFIEPIPFQ